MSDIRAYYNEIDPFAADWLRALMAHGLIASGDVDTRSIIDVRPDDLRPYTQCHFFAGIGGWSYALRQAGWDDTRPVWTGSCPCQPFSLAGKQKGFDDARHLWPVWRELIRECDPAVVFGEQVASATEWLGLVRSDLEAMGRAVGAMPIQAASAGADHLRDRYWFVAHTNDARSQGWRLLPKRAGERTAGPDGLADATGDDERRDRQPGESCGSQVQAGGLCSSGDVAHGDGQRGQIDQDARGGVDGNSAGEVTGPCCSGHVADASSGRFSGPSEGQSEQPGRTEAERPSDTGDMADLPSQRCEHAPISWHAEQHSECGAGAVGIGSGRSNFDWVVGADGKARRVKPGLCLLAHGVSGRVGKLRGFGNAIDPRPAAAFIEAADFAMRGPSVCSNQGGGT